MGVYEKHEMRASQIISRKMEYEREYERDSRNADGNYCEACGERIKRGEFATRRNGKWWHADCVEDF